MTFVVSGLSEAGFTAVRCGTVTNALAKAVELLRVGHVDVLVADSTGLQYTADEFLRLFRV